VNDPRSRLRPARVIAPQASCPGNEQAAHAIGAAKYLVFLFSVSSSAWHRACLHLCAMKNPRWRVAIVDDHPRSRSELSSAITAAGGVVAAQSAHAGEAVELIGRVRPDVAIFAVGLPDGDGVGAARAVMAAAPCPIVLFTSHRGDELIERARAAGVMGYLLKPLRPGELPPALDLAIARYGEIRRQRLEARKLIERAKGLLMARQGLSEEEAFHALRRTAMNQRRSMAQIAQAVILSESMAKDVLARS